MRFGVLGPLTVWNSGGGQVRIPELKVRALLTQLIVDAGRVVPADRLIDVLWGDALPANPAASLQTRASQLRKVLEAAEPGGRRLLVSRPPGYVLDVEPGAVDSGRFQLLVAQAGGTGDPRDRAALLGEALALWRGPALLDFADEEWTRSARTRLDEQRLTAHEALAEARLDLGEHTMLADELGDLVSRHPLRERLRSAHLRALYLSGRQNDALASYQDLRHRLATELGVDPGPEIAALHLSILNQDVAAAPVPPTPPPAPRPRTGLPLPLTGLIGRADAIEEVGALLAAGRLVTLTGPGGVGKTRLAVETARRSPSEACLVELASATRSDEVPELVATALGIRDDTTGGLTAKLTGALQAKSTLLVLDNCEHVAGPVADLTSALLRAAPDLRVLATSRRPLNVSGEVLWNVQPLAGADAVELFVARATAAAPGFALTAGNETAVAAICRRLDGIPLALELAATRVRSLGVHELSERLDDRFRLLKTGHGDAPARQRTLRAAIDWSWEPLADDEKRTLRRLAVHSGGFTLAAAEAVTGEDVLDVLPRLVDSSLVTFGEGRYHLLESVAAYCREKLEEADELARVQDAHRRHYTALAVEGDAHLRGPAQREWLRRLDAETANLRTALDHGGGVRLATSLAWYWVLRGRLGEGLRSLTSALAAEDDPTARIWRAAFTLRTGGIPDPADLAAVSPAPHAEAFLAHARVGVGDLTIDETRAARALATARATGDRWGTAAALNVLARQAVVHGDLAGLRDLGAQSMAIFTGLGDQWGRLNATFALGVHAEITGDYAEAARLHREGLRIAEDLDLPADVSDKLSLLGRIALLEGDHARADDLHLRARANAVRQGYAMGEEFADLGLALSYRRQGRFDEAEPLLHRWLEWNRGIDSEVAQALILAELGFIAELRGDAGEARGHHEQSLKCAVNAGDPRSMALAHEGLAGAHSLAGDLTAASRHLAEATALRESVGAPLPVAERGDVDRVIGRLGR
ncbi:BTAD domain-containing putative transcriptional regulator [Spirillospora sp. NPDC047279]|uniref:BTAD domain-containing putative transcriptional regulator n=1 Tax=Spirillospora sp. NPDC047279 TaxID=3155478 RepID=UPI0033F010F3